MAKFLTWIVGIVLLSTLGAGLVGGGRAGAQGLPGGDKKEDVAPAPKKPAAPANKPAAKPAPSCALVTTEGPRGGRLEVEGQGFGKAPLVRIATRITRMIERTETRIAVQIPRDSDGGAVTVKVGELEIACGTLTIIGKN